MSRVRFIHQKIDNKILKVKLKEIVGDKALVNFDEIIGDGWVDKNLLCHTVDEALRRQRGVRANG